MAIMIPSVISPEVKSNAEKKIFRWFQEAPGTDNWVVLHSLGITTHNKVIYGETDFLVLAPKLGIYAIEVKGGRVRREQGTWYFTDKYNKTNSKERGPFEQAKDGIFSIMEAVKSRADYAHRNISGLLFGYGVMFPDVEYSIAGITEEEQWQVFDSRDGTNVKGFIQRLSNGAKMKWESIYGPLGKEKLPDTPDINYLSSLLRGDFDYAVSLNVQLHDAGESLVTLTKGQYRCLDQLDDNPRCLIQGPAGTGKTLLALEEAKKFAAKGDRVALFCFNSNLADWLKYYFDRMPESVKPAYIGTLHSFMKKIVEKSGIAPAYFGEMDAQDYYQRELPEAAALALLDEDNLFDAVIIDEAQDLIRDSYLDVLSCCLKKGISRGKWTMFGDFSMQAIYADQMSSESMIELLEKQTSFSRFRLTQNCRNTKPICREIETVTGFVAPKGDWTTVDGPPVQYITWATMEKQCERLEALLQKLAESGIKPEEITILSPRKRESSVVSMIEKAGIIDFKIPCGKNTVFSTIQSYKGLENTVIILTDIESFLSDKLMYVALSRARSGLYVLESDKAKKEYDKLMMRRLNL